MTRTRKPAGGNTQDSLAVCVSPPEIKAQFRDLELGDTQLDADAGPQVP